MNIVQALAQAHGLGVDRLEAQTLMLHALGRDRHDRAWLLLHDTDEPSLSILKAFNALVQRRLQHEPLAYLTGFQDFHGLTLQTDARALVPRPDTETLVNWALSLDFEAGDKCWTLVPAAAPSLWPYNMPAPNGM